MAAARVEKNEIELLHQSDCGTPFPRPRAKTV
jgi:hypothetical protein